MTNKNKREPGWYPGHSVNHYMNPKTYQTLCGRRADIYALDTEEKERDNCTICRDIMSFMLDHSRFFDSTVSEYTIKQRIGQLTHEKQKAEQKVEYLEKQIQNERKHLDQFQGDTMKHILKMAMEQDPTEDI